MQWIRVIYNIGMGYTCTYMWFVSVGICGPGGRCRDVAGGHQCICPMGRIGSGCRQSKGINIIKFKNLLVFSIFMYTVFLYLLFFRKLQCLWCWKLNIPYIAAVQVIYPQFNGSSFSSYDPIRNSRIQLKIEIEIKPESLDDGIVLYSGQNEDGSGDYVVVLMKDGYLEFRYNTGSGNVSDLFLASFYTNTYI